MTMAIAVGIGTAAAGVYGANMAASSQRDANAVNVQLTREAAAQEQRQFDAKMAANQQQLDMQASQFGEKSRQFGADLRDRQDQFSAAQDLNIQALNAKENRFGFGIDNTNAQTSSRRSREDAINQSQQARFDQMRGENIQALDPYKQAGKGASQSQADMLGLNGASAQQAAYAQINESPGQKFLRERQRRALLRSSAAIGGLGGGNVRTALQQQAVGFAQQDVQNQFNRLNALSNRGAQASHTQASIGTGPSYIQTGQDRGVGLSSSSYQPTEYQNTYQPSRFDAKASLLGPPAPLRKDPAAPPARVPPARVPSGLNNGALPSGFNKRKL